MEKLLWLDGLKGVLCVLIVLYHYTARYTEIYGTSFPVAFTNGAEIGVCAFFIISGFLTWMNLRKLYENKWRWIVNKYLRLWVPYIVCITITLVSLKIFGLPGRDNISLIQVIRDIVMLPFVSGHIEGATWYVMSLIHFYILIFLTSKQRIFENFWFHLIVAMIFICSPLFEFRFLDIATKVLGEFPLYWGGQMFLCQRDRRFLWLLIFEVLAMLFLDRAYVTVVVVIILFLLLSKKNYLRPIYYLLSERTLVKLGLYSYTWYLLHQNIGYMIMYHLTGIVSNWMLPFIALFATLFLTISVEKVIKRFKTYIDKHIIILLS